MKIDDIAPVSGDENAAAFTERARISAILESPEGQRNPEMAREFALRTPLSADTAKAILAKTPPANPYLAALAKLTPSAIATSEPKLIEGDAKAARLAEISETMTAINNERRKATGLPLIKRGDA